jgi:DNA-binding NarL/FixJ family response regulator
VTASPIRLLLVDDHAAFRLPLALILERESDLRVVAQTGSLAEARAVLPEIVGQVDVALIDLQLLDGNGIELVRELRAMNPAGHTIVLTADTDKRHHAQAAEAGAEGIIVKSAQPFEIVDAIRRVHAGELALPAREMIELLRLAGEERRREQASQAVLAQLTPREREVLAALAEGLDNKAIAERLFISPDTARTHVVKVLGKLGVESRLQAAIVAIQHGIWSPGRRTP